MSLIIGLTGAAGLLFSFVLLQLGVTSMALRYPLAPLMVQRSTPIAASP